MAISISKIEETYSILKNYDGVNLYVSYIKRCVDNGYKELSEFDVKYILDNKDFAPVKVNKIVKITEWFAKTFADKNNIDFIPEKLSIISVIGEMGDSFHCYVRYRKSVVEPLLTFIPKKALMDDIFVKDYKSNEIDFNKYNDITAHLNRKLKPHQEEDIKFLITNQRVILASQQGLGKSASCVVASMVGEYKKILIICPASLKGTWKREISLYNNPEDVELVYGKKMNGDKKYTVINYDIIENFYIIPKEQEYEIVLEKDENGIERRVTKPVLVKCKGLKGKKGETEFKYKKTRKTSIIKECLSKSPLFLNQYDLVIIDEAHKLSKNKSIRYETISDFLNRSKPKGTYLVTGTPLTNNPLNLYHLLKLINADVVRDYDYYMKRFCDMHEMKLKDGRTVKLCDGATNLDELREKIKNIYVRRLQKDIPGMVSKTIEKRYYTLNDVDTAECNKLWGDYLHAKYLDGSDISQYKDLIEGGLIRRYLADKMIENTISLAEEHIEDDEKVFIVCCYDNEVEKFKKHFGDLAVVYNGKMTNKQKDKAEHEFMTNPKIKVFIGQIIASGVGLTLTKSHICIFNTFSWLSIENDQAMDRVFRLTQTEDVTVYFQLFDDENTLNMWDKVMDKDRIFNEIIKGENEK